MSTEEPYYLAHTARCKLQLAAERPDRDLRFILGHAFTLDKLILRIVEIENENSSDDDSDSEDLAEPRHAEHDQHVYFHSNTKPDTTAKARKRSPPPNQDAHPDGSDSESSDEAYEYDENAEEENDLSLHRYASASAQPQRTIDDVDSISSDEDEPRSPPSIPSEAELELITQGPENEDLVDLYQHVKKCPCHGQHENVPTVTKAWDVPQKEGQQGKRVAVVQIAS